MKIKDFLSAMCELGLNLMQHGADPVAQWQKTFINFCFCFDSSSRLQLRLRLSHFDRQPKPNRCKILRLKPSDRGQPSGPGPRLVRQRQVRRLQGVQGPFRGQSRRGR